MATRRTRAVKTAQTQTPAKAQAIQEPGLPEEVMGELEHGGKSAEDLAVALEVAMPNIIDALEVLFAEGSVRIIFVIAKGGAR